jgi:hypothetical protein
MLKAHLLITTEQSPRPQPACSAPSSFIDHWLTVICLVLHQPVTKQKKVEHHDFQRTVNGENQMALRRTVDATCQLTDIVGLQNHLTTLRQQ